MTRLERADGVLPLSLIVLARNEEAVIGRCLDSVPFAAEKIVIDSGSTDGTAAAAAAHGATVIDREWLGFGPMRRRAEEDAAHEWILMLDADEWMSDELQRQCRDELPRLLERTDALQLSRRTRYCGRTMNHYRPFARDHIWRCYRKGRAAWTSDQVHERLRPAPGCRTHRLTAPLVHDSYASVAHHQEKACRYVDLWARQAFERGRKPRLLGTFLSLPAYLVRDLVLRRGAARRLARGHRGLDHRPQHGDEAPAALRALPGRRPSMSTVSVVVATRGDRREANPRGGRS